MEKSLTATVKVPSTMHRKFSNFAIAFNVEKISTVRTVMYDAKLTIGNESWVILNVRRLMEPKDAKRIGPVRRAIYVSFSN